MVHIKKKKNDCTIDLLSYCTELSHWMKTFAITYITPVPIE